MFPYDDKLLAAVQGAPKSVDDVIGTMQAIDAICADGDGLKWFNWLYLGVTQAVGKRVTAGGFQDPAWMAALDVQFAGLYFAALRSALSGGDGAAVLEGAVRAAQLDGAGANSMRAGGDQCAHQSRSADCDRADRSGAGARGCALPGLHGAECHARALVDTAKAELHVRLLGDLLPPVSQLEDTVAAFSVTAAQRSGVEPRARCLWALRGFPRLSARMRIRWTG